MSDILSLPNENEINKLPKDGGEKYNRLIFSNSPYLLQHAENPVDWYEWSDEAFQKAKRENKPVFLSIGYSTCHWCHVMAHDSFEDPEIAKLINQFMVPIKLDREERPDIDQIYMAVCQAMSGHGGWPLSAFLTPEKEAFFVTTFIPKDSQSGRVGMRELIPNIAYSWREDRKRIQESVDSVINFFKNRSETSKTEVRVSFLDKAYRFFQENFDKDHGGFGSAPKFPSPHNLLFLLQFSMEFKNNEAKSMAEKTLIEMRKSGLFDQLAYGFHRYATDRQWLVPHFEKMLYDQAMLILAYSKAYSESNNEFFKEVVYEIINYLDSDLKSKNDLYFSAEDADSEGEEGLFYTWTIGEIKENVKNFERFCSFFNITVEGNYLEEHTRTKNKRNILHLDVDSVLEIKKEFKFDLKKLLDIRNKRIRPHLDDKILLDWNALLLASLAYASSVFKDKSLLKKAIYFEEELYKTFFKNGELFHRHRNGNTAIPAMIDDYAFLIWAEIELFKSSYDMNYLERAVRLEAIVNSQFWDMENGFYYYASEKTESIVGRQKEFYDGAIPSGNSVMFYNIVQLYQYSLEETYHEKIKRMLKNLPKEIEDYPSGFSMFQYAYLHHKQEKSHLIIVSENRDELDRLEEIKPKNLAIIHLKQSYNLIEELPFLSSFSKEKTAYYYCNNFVCQKPIYDFETIKAQLLK